MTRYTSFNTPPLITGYVRPSTVEDIIGPEQWRAIVRDNTPRIGRLLGLDEDYAGSVANATSLADVSARRKALDSFLNRQFGPRHGSIVESLRARKIL